MNSEFRLVALALLLSACGVPAAPDVGFVKAASTPPSPICQRVKAYYDALASEGCEPYIPPPATYDDASCNQVSVDLDFCYSDPTCWLAVQQQDVATCHANGKHDLLPQWIATE